MDKKPSDYFNRKLFWEMDPEKLDWQKNKLLIMERVLTRGDLDDYHSLIEVYGKQEIKNQAPKLHHLDKKTLNFLSVMYDIPKCDFICFSKTRSI